MSPAGPTRPSHDERTTRRTRLRWLLPALLILGWLGVVTIAGPYGGRLSEVQQNDSAAFLPETAESTEVAAFQREISGDQPLPAVVVAERDGRLTDADLAFLGERSEEIAVMDGVDAPPSPPIPSEDGHAARLFVPLANGGDAEPKEVVEDIRRLLAEDRPDGLDIHLTGPAGIIADLTAAFAGIDGLLLLVAAGVVAVILVIVYRSPLLPLTVLVSSTFALVVAVVVVYFLATNGWVTLNGQSQGILFILVFGAATDYALLLVARYREELGSTQSTWTAMRRAWRATVEPVLASAGTVIAGLLCLLFSDLSSNSSLGPVAAVGIAASVLAALTFLPAALVLLGRRAFWPFRPEAGAIGRRGLWQRIADMVAARPRRFWVGTTLVLLVGAAFMPQLRATGTSETEVFLTSVESVAGEEALARHFPGGSGLPTVVVTEADRLDEVLAATESVDGVSEVSVLGATDPSAPPSGPPADGPADPVVLDGRAAVEAVLDHPVDSDAAVDTVRELREVLAGVEGANALVGGPTASQLDTQETATRDLVVIVPIVLVVIFAILALLLRALLAPLLLIATVVLSLAATLGVGALLFNHVLDFPGADPSVPLFAFVFLVALGIDYNIFLMTRVREESVTKGTRVGTVRGLAVTGGVITSAGLVLAATFSALVVIPLLFLAQLAFLVAFGVLVDTLLVRSLLVPALTLDIGSRVWWPSRLASGRTEEAAPEPAPTGEQG
ncbi:MMPL family transporter [Actinoalloteichus caeruleus]|uniref:MMPL family transporter n=1 Tax=Actinoalloteichus cyanogriseus TaxID=2893586 RepID=UPI00068FE58B|nr:MMPL family transporter [Actinoalloteichus caeruleus]